MSMATTSAFDFAEFKRALEERDVEAQLAAFGADAEVTLVDRINTPGSPRVLRGREEIRTWIEDICERDMTHRVEMTVAEGGGAAFSEACRYPDGTNVLCVAVMQLREGRIDRLVGVQAWDE